MNEEGLADLIIELRDLVSRLEKAWGKLSNEEIIDATEDKGPKT